MTAPAPGSSTFAERVRNWALCHRLHAERHRCRSLEGHYRAPRGQEAEYDNGLPVPSAPHVYDWRDAWTVELAWRRLRRVDRWIIKLHHHDRCEAGIAIRRLARIGLHLHRRHYSHRLAEARARLRTELEFLDAVQNARVPQDLAFSAFLATIRRERSGILTATIPGAAPGVELPDREALVSPKILSCQ